MFPLKKRQLIRGFQAHIRAGLGGGGDYVANRNELLAPFSGTISREYFGSDGGNWLWMDKDGVSYQFAHLSEYKAKQGQSVKEGQVIAITGNTGNITTGPHLHIQIVQGGKRLDPEKINWGSQPEGEKVDKDKAIGILTNALINDWRAKHYDPNTLVMAEPDRASIRREAEAMINGQNPDEVMNKWTDDMFKTVKQIKANSGQPVPVTEDQKKEFAKDFIIKKLFS